MENGINDGRPALLTIPQNKTDGYIQALFPAFTVQGGDRFKATIGCQDGATACYVTFRIDYRTSAGTKTLWTFRERYDGILALRQSYRPGWRVSERKQAKTG